MKTNAFFQIATRLVMGQLFLILMTGCGTQKTNSRVIASTSSVMDVRIFSGDSLNRSHESSALVGFDEDSDGNGSENGDESRMLIYFPDILQLWSADTIISSITQVELLVKCNEVDVNPDNIQLYSASRAWNAYATWESPMSLLHSLKWDKAGGDFDDSIAAVTPGIRRSNSNDAKFELYFDVTSQVKDLVTSGREHFGYLIRIAPSSLNNRDQMKFFTANATDSVARPSAQLVFTSKDTIE